MKPLSIYIHIPFCKEKCFYCDFLSFTNKKDYYEQYLYALLKEISEFALNHPSEYSINSVFIGGGTPSILPLGHVQKIMQLIFQKFKFKQGAEITIEANPGVLSKELMLSFKESGINRISIGFQAWQNKILKDIGRVHTKEQFLENFFNLREIGFKNINIDLMFSLPNQTLADWEETLNEIIKLKPEHISCYSLIIEEGTVFHKLYEKNQLDLSTEEKDREMYYKAIELLSQNGYEQYEISNFALNQKKCYHNTVYWTRKEYAGFGLGAASLLNETRTKNTDIFEDYIAFENKKTIEILNETDRYSEFIFLGLRMIKGIKKSEFEETFKKSIYSIYEEKIKKLLAQKLIYDDGDYIKLTKKGLDLSNLVFIEFL